VNADEVVGTPREYEVWLAPDWSDYNEKQKKASTWTRVSVRETLYADGRRITQVLDENRAPITTRALAEDRDAAQEKRFKDAQTTASRETAQAERKETRTYTGTDPQTGRPATVTEYESGPPKYDEIKPAGAAGAKEWRTEGTPDGQGGFDNSRPIMAAYVNGQRTGETRAANAKELEDWNLAGQMTRNPGGKTDAQLAADAKEAEARKPKPALTYTTINGQRYTTQTTPGVDGGAPTIQHFGPDGKPVAALPTEPGKDTTTTVTRNGQTYIQHSVAKPDGTSDIYHTDQSGARVQLPAEADKSGYGVEPEGAPEQVYTAGQMTSGLRQYSSWLSAQVKLHKDSGGTQGVSPADATKLMDRRIALAESALKEQEGLANAQSGLLTNATTQRGQTLGETQSRRGAAERISTSAQNTIAPLAAKAGRGKGGLAVDAINAQLGRSREYIDAFGGFRESPEVNPDSFPALAELRRSSMTGIQTAAQGGPQIFDARAMTTPLSPEQTAAAGPPPEIPMTPERVQGIMQNPVFRPQPMATVGTPAPPASNPISNTPITLPPVRDDWAQPAPPLVNPPVGEPGNNPQAPVGQMPPSRFMQETRYGPGNYWDPVQRGAELANRLGIAPEVLKQALGAFG
jgi:hypothetical protein